MNDRLIRSLTLLFLLLAAAAPGCGGSLAGGTTPTSQSITNNQEAGVDEGGIIKAHGDHLLVLRRGRLFSIDVAGGRLQPRARIDVPAAGERGGWYDEMLVLGDTVAVIGYSSSERATELALFDIDADGHFGRRGTFYIRSDDYYSSRNYAGRVVGNRLVFYMPYRLGQTRPEIRERGEPWRPVVAQRSARTFDSVTSRDVLHTVLSCDLSRPGLSCETDGVVGGPSRSFYVSPEAVYLWTGRGRPWYWETRDERETNAVLYRMPFREGAPRGALHVSGMPTDQLSFRERDGELAVLVRAVGYGDAMWGAEAYSAGDVALLRVPLRWFARGESMVPASRYSRLPRPMAGRFVNRFVGDHVLYGAGEVLTTHRLEDGTTTRLAMGHEAERIEALGRDAVVIGPTGRDLSFSSVSLRGTPSVASRYVQRGAAQGESRTHGFFYHPESERGGVLGLPVRGEGSRYRSLFQGSAGVLFLEVQDLTLRPLGQLNSGDGDVDDHCRASCVDWYGNARPIFYRGRVFALLGYELVEGHIGADAVREVQRARFLMMGGSQPLSSTQ